MELPPPKNVRQLRRFLGICQYQARFLITYAKEVQPLRELLKKKTINGGGHRMKSLHLIRLRHCSWNGTITENR